MFDLGITLFVMQFCSTLYCHIFLLLLELSFSYSENF
jgi:hypothetical protein